MMGKASSSLKINLLKTISVVIAGFMMVFLSSSRTLDSPQFQSSNDFEQLLSEGFKDGNQFELDLNKLDLHALREAYLTLDENEKFTGTEFPFFDELAFEKLVALQGAYPDVKTSILYEKSPDKKEIKKDVFEQWKKTRNISLTIDDIKRDVSELNNYQPDDFAMFTVRETDKGAFLKKASYNVSLMTQEYFHGKYYRSRKKIELIQAEYPTSEKVVVFYGQKYRETADGKTRKISPDNYEASIFHQLRVIDPVELIEDFPKLIKHDESKSFSITISRNERRFIAVMKLPTI